MQGSCSGASRQSDSTDQVREPWVAADRVEKWVRFQELQDVRLLLIGLLQPIEGLIGVAKPQICVHKRARWNIARLFASLQLLKKLQRIGARPAWAYALISTPVTAGLPGDTDSALSNTGMASAG